MVSRQIAKPFKEVLEKNIFSADLKDNKQIMDKDFDQIGQFSQDFML